MSPLSIGLLSLRMVAPHLVGSMVGARAARGRVRVTWKVRRRACDGEHCGVRDESWKKAGLNEEWYELRGLLKKRI